jgi:hypothetical protein
MTEPSIIGFVAGTPLLTADGFKAIEDIKPGDTIQVQPDDDQGDGKPEVHEDGHAGDTLRWWELN